MVTETHGAARGGGLRSFYTNNRQLAKQHQPPPTRPTAEHLKRFVAPPLGSATFLIKCGSARAIRALLSANSHKTHLTDSQP